MNTFKNKLYHIIFGAETASGKLFDIVLIFAILLSVLVVMLDSVAELNTKYGEVFYIIELGLTLLFTLEYIARIYISEHKWKYIFSFYGIVDFLSIFPTYFGFFFAAKATPLITIRALRLLRVFRVLKLIGFVTEAGELKTAMKASQKKILVFLLTVLALVTILGTLMYMIESGGAGFTSIPKSVYWAIVTLTTVGYGDIAPITSIGQFIASLIMILGYAIIAVPTGIVSTEMKSLKDASLQTAQKTCPRCKENQNKASANYCSNCGEAFQ